MAYNFKNLNEVERQDKPTENTTVMAFESGKPKQIPASEFGGKGLVVDLRGYTLSTGGQPTTISDMSYDPIYEAITTGKNVVFQVQIGGVDMFMPPMSSCLVPKGLVPESPFSEGGFIVTTSDVTIAFTNGSYHTTA